jgi:hypothetical protein
MKSRAGEVRAQVIPSVGMVDLHKAIKSNVATGSMIYTDQWVGYRGLREYKHDAVNHSAGEYVKGDCHTQAQSKLARPGLRAGETFSQTHLPTTSATSYCLGNRVRKKFKTVSVDKLRLA